MDLGAARRGVDMGPSALRIAQVAEKLKALGYQVTDRGNVDVQGRESLDESESKAKYLGEIAQTLKKVADITYDMMKATSRPLVLGGDHSIAMGTVAGIAKFLKESNQKLGIIWFDAHGDINTPETTLSGNIHGMPVAHILGMGAKELRGVCPFEPMVDPRNLVLIGLRDLDAAERIAIKKQNLLAFTMREIDELGMPEVMKRAIAAATQGTVGFHTSFDMDGLDPSMAPGVGTAVPGGITYREAHLAMEMIADTGKMLSMEVTETNPVLDTANKTALLACEMICSAFGKKIL